MLHPNFIQERVFVIGDGSLFDEGITNLLKYEINLIVSHAIYSEDLAFLKRINADPPDVILVCESVLLDTARLLESISSQPKLRSLIVVARLYNNMVEVYANPILTEGKISSKPQQFIVKKRDDLLNIVKGKHFSYVESGIRTL